MEFNQKTIGIGLIIVAVILIIILAFVKLNFDSQAVFLCEAVNADPSLQMAECPAHTSPIPWLLIFSFGISFLVLGSGIYLIVASQKILTTTQNETSGKETDLTKLNHEEKQIHAILTEHNGSCYQSDLVKKLELSKVKITRLLDKMEGMGILERKRRGMTNIVILK
ncbi:TPA: MarR family transcriptional regulator [Candidatus Woesearchaeota archaeon]|nr:hypothetical protein [archaeon]HIJ11582.1 MarR family transcriptional regulator [Candidatus Woesearchaeota archaeon]|tara:strand:+ start:30 stop:530 length:501 start_codon:yes stop_codon:yes gene_type:complete